MSEIYDTCGDDRFELIAKAKQKLLDATNIDSRPDEIAVLDNILFRCWQMGWLDQLRDADTRWQDLFGTPERAARTLANVCRFTHGGELCDRCQCYIFDGCDRTLRLMSERSIYDALLEWLRGDAE